MLARANEQNWSWQPIPNLKMAYADSLWLAHTWQMSFNQVRQTKQEDTICRSIFKQKVHFISRPFPYAYCGIYSYSPFVHVVIDFVIILRRLFSVMKTLLLTFKVIYVILKLVLIWFLFFLFNLLSFHNFFLSPLYVIGIVFGDHRWQ